MNKHWLFQKIASRKFWALIAGFVGSLLVAFNVGENEIAQVTAVITAFGSVVVYILAEASVDKASLENQKENVIVVKQSPDEEELETEE